MSKVTNASEAVDIMEYAESPRLGVGLVAEWLEDYVTQNDGLGYTHRLLKERSLDRAQIRDLLQEWIDRAHDDARRHLRKVGENSLDPLGEIGLDPAQGYPELLPLVTLKGYFGEVFAAVVAEELPHFGHYGWRVPAFPFRYHETAFDYLEKLREGADVPGAIVGRTGDDMVAFRMGTNGKILASLVCEAKCTSDHNASMIFDAHKKASARIARPIEIRRLVMILREYDDDESKKWRDALSLHYIQSDQVEHERCDLVCYVCARSPLRSATWMPVDRPHSQYRGGRKLESVEIHLVSVDDLVRDIYGAQRGENGIAN